MPAITSKTLLIALVTMVSGMSQNAHAVDLQNCNKGTINKRIACLQQNTTNLNAAITALQQKVGEIPKPVDVSQFVRKNQPVKFGLNNNCLSSFTGESGAIPANPNPIDVRLLVGFQDCGGAPSWSFR